MGAYLEGDNFLYVFIAFIVFMVFHSTYSSTLWFFIALILVLYGFSTLVFKYSMDLVLWF